MSYFKQMLKNLFFIIYFDLIFGVILKNTVKIELNPQLAFLIRLMQSHFLLFYLQFILFFLLMGQI